MKRLAWVVMIVVVAVIGGVVFLVMREPFPEELLDESRFVSTTVVATDGSVLHDGLSAAGGRGEWLRPDEVPQMLANAVIAAEDRRFRSHPGVDPLAITRAIVTNVRDSGAREGGSTITQQVVKMLLRAGSPGVDRNRNLIGKTHEAVLALRLERVRSKDEILALWLNVAPFGGTMTGARRASMEWFGVEPKDLTLEQAALLAGVPNRPALFDPRRHPERARQRRDSVLRKMLELQMISRAEFDEALDQPVRVSDLRFREALAPHAMLRALQQTAPAIASIELTIDPQLQRSVRGIVQAKQRELDRHGAGAVAVVVLDNVTGEWLAWEGSGAWGDERRSGSIDGVTSPRHPGSALKPFVYAAAFESGFTPSSVLPDIPSTYATAEEGVNYVPRNYDDRFRGPVLARAALAGSLNVPAVHLASRVGVPAVIRMLNAASISTLEGSADWYGLGVALGGGEVRLDELTAAYALFARGGVWRAPSLIRRTRSASGAWSAPPRPADRRVVSARTAFLVSDVLSDPVARSYVFGRDGALEFEFPVAVKTGTSQAYRDNWTIGYTARVTVGVWVGNFDRTPLRHSSGVTGAAPIFHAVMLAANERYPSTADRLPVPSGLSRAAVCALSGDQPGVHCRQVLEEWMIDGTGRSLCSWHRRGGEENQTVLPPAYHAWRDSQRGERVSRVSEPDQKARFAITQPAEGTVYLLDDTLRSEYQAVPLRATGARGGVRWSVNGQTISPESSSGKVNFPLRRGRHVITAEADDGRLARVTIQVR